MEQKIGNQLQKNYIEDIMIEIKFLEQQNNVDNIGHVI